MIREDRWKWSDNLRRKLFIKYEIKRIILKSTLLNSNIPRIYSYYALYHKSAIIRGSAIIQQRNRCVQSGRIRTVIKKTQYSRFVFRSEAYAGNLPGCKRASW